MTFAIVKRTAIVLACALLVSACNDESNDLGPSSGANTAFDFLEGTWNGTWTDARYNVSGTLQAIITVSGSNVTGTGTIGLQSLGFGLGSETGTASGTASGNTLTFSFSSATVGSGTGTLSANGQGNGAGTVSGVLNFGAFTYTGTASGTTISGSFQFTSPTGGFGVASLTKQ